jgi:anthranilate phosphoribosyltransferase
MASVMRAIMNGEATAAQIGGFVIALRMKGETVKEIAAAARVMRELVTPVAVAKQDLVDTCGTGGDGASTFNISTTSAFVAAAAGARVAKHGNRSVSSNCGSADVLEAAGVRIDLAPEEVARCVETIGVGFMFAPLHHGAMRHAVAPRRELGTRTIFNLLGPLTNPAGAPNQLLGVFSHEWLTPLALVLKELGSRHAMVVHADDGLDEISISAPTKVVELNEGEVASYTVNPEQFGMELSDPSAIAVDSAEQSRMRMREVLDNMPGPALDIVLLNAGAAIYVAGIAASFERGIELARAAIAEGKAKEKLDALVQYSQAL